MRKHLILSVAAALAFAVSAFAQISSPGEVVEVIDGRTVVVAIATGKVTVELQYIDVPENGQPMYDTVREHLRKMLLGKIVMFRARTYSRGLTVGRLTLKDTDVSQQLLRDGAAWHVPQKTSGQEPKEFDAYAAMEAVARAEKRGIWSVAGMQPAWEYRAAKLENERLKERASQPSASYKSGPSSQRSGGYWSDKNPALGNVGALTHGYNAATKTGWVSTSMLGVEQTEEAKLNDWKTAVDFTYWYKEDERKGRSGIFIVTVISNYIRFPKNNDLVLFEDKPLLVMGKAKRTVEKSGDESWEKITYSVQRSSIEKMLLSVAKLKIDDDLLELRGFVYSVMYNMLKISEQRQVAEAPKSKR